MPKALTDSFFSLKELLKAYAPYVAAFFVLLALAFWWIKPTPPKTVVMATGPAQSAYAEIGKRYQEWFKKYGIKVELRESKGSSDNLSLLRKGTVDVGFVQGGSGQLLPDDYEELQTLGSLFVEPIWVFYREESAHKHLGRGKTLESLSQLKGWRMNFDAEGSGVKTMMDKLFDINRMSETDFASSTRLDDTPAAIALIEGKIDAMVLVQAPESLIVQMLLMTPGIKLMDFSQNQAYARRLAFLSAVTLPRGVVDLAKDQPMRDIGLVAPTTSLVTQEYTHPALLHLFSMAAHEFHDEPSWFAQAHEFPNLKHDALPASPEAARYIKNGAPFLQRHLPFWAANLIDRMWVVLGILLAIMLPISKILPPLYKFRVRQRIFKWYATLGEIEEASLAKNLSESKRGELSLRLNELEAKVDEIEVPLSYAEELYALKSNIQLVRLKLGR